MQQQNRPSIPHVVIVGGGFGGLEAARTLRDAPVRVTLIDRNNHHTFQPLLYQVATAGLSPADIASPIRSILSKQDNIEVLLGEVTGIDTQAQQVQVQGWHDTNVAYDYLILATGARYNYFGHDEWEKQAPGLKSITDATNIRRDILLAFEAAETEPDPAKRQALLTFVVVGGGPTGVEMAGAISELASRALARDFDRIDPRQAHIVLVEAGPELLAGFPTHLAESARHALERMGVDVRLKSPVELVNEQGVTIGGQLLPASTIVWAAGVVGSPAGKWLGAETDRAGRVCVNPDLTVPGHPNIFVIGDTAHAAGPNGKPLPGVAQVAKQGGHYASTVIKARIQRQPTPPPFRYNDLGNMATVGRKFAIADIGLLKVSGWFAWILWLVVHVVALIGFRNRLSVLFQWAWAYFTYERGARLITMEGDAPRVQRMREQAPESQGTLPPKPATPPREEREMVGAANRETRW